MGAGVESGTRWLDRAGLDQLVRVLSEAGHEVIGPRVGDGAVILGPIASVAELPRGTRDVQEPGKYRLLQTGEDLLFDAVVGPHSLKPYLFPPRVPVLQVLRVRETWEARTPEPCRVRRAIVGVRSCDLKALAIQDKVFLEGPYRDPEYAARRANLFLVGVNCGRSAPTCFCVSMETGPAIDGGADLVLTELPGGFLAEAGSAAGLEVLGKLATRAATTHEVEAARHVPKRAAAQQTRRVDLPMVHGTLMNNLEHSRWSEVGRRCLSCANCTMVCPTCFCSTVNEVSDLTGNETTRERVWESCFNEEHSRMSSGPVHADTRSRYRQWLTHKFGTWIDQFGMSGCVGCGRCLTWCPVGIDVTEELAALGREETR